MSELVCAICGETVDSYLAYCTECGKLNYYEIED